MKTEDAEKRTEAEGKRQEKSDRGKGEVKKIFVGLSVFSLVMMINGFLQKKF